MRTLLALAIVALAPAVAHAQYSNADRFTVIKSALADAAHDTDAAAGKLAGVTVATQQAPLNLSRFDTPDNDSFAAEAATLFPWGTMAGNLGNPAAAWAIGARCTKADGRTYGVKTDLANMWSTVAAAPAFPACADNTHLLYNELLRDLRTCGDKCFVDIASLDNIDVIRSRLRGAMLGWLAGKPATAKLVVRITIGYSVNRNAAMEDYLDYFSNVVRQGAGKVEVYGATVGHGMPGTGVWSHAKMFGVYDIAAKRYRALFGGQNHWVHYDDVRPPFDTNTMVTGNGAAQPALQLDGALAWFDNARSMLGRRLYWRTPQNDVRNASYRWGDAAAVNGQFATFSGLTNTNPRTVPAIAANDRALVSLIDMGAYSVNAKGRTIARVLHDLVASEDRNNMIRVFQQQICRAAAFGVDGNCSGRSVQTYIGELVKRALLAARQGWALNVKVLTSSSSIKNKGYAGPFARSVRSMLETTGEEIACTGITKREFKNATWRELAKFDNPRGQGDCRAAVRRAINGRFAMRWTNAFLNGFAGPGRQAVGVHHKLVMFAGQAMFQGSFNAYPSAVTSGVNTTYDSKLVENGGVILDSLYTGNQVSAFDTAWEAATPIIAGETSAR